MTLNVKPTLADLRTLALAAVGLVAPDGLADEPVWTADMLGPCVAAIRTAPDAKDRRLVELAAAMRLSDAELMTVALCAAAEGDAAAARAVAHAQAPLGGSRPLVGLAAAAFAALGASPLGLAAGAAAACEAAAGRRRGPRRCRSAVSRFRCRSWRRSRACRGPGPG